MHRWVGGVKAHKQVSVTNHGLDCNHKLADEWLNDLVTDLVDFVVDELAVLNYV